jgi:hypothetical protein
MAQLLFRGLNEHNVEQARTTITLENVSPPYGLPQLLIIRRQASELLGDDPRFVSATVVHVHEDSPEQTKLDASVERSYLTRGPARRSPGASTKGES